MSKCQDFEKEKQREIDAQESELNHKRNTLLEGYSDAQKTLENQDKATLTPTLTLNPKPKPKP